jgi:hypothetical protein
MIRKVLYKLFLLLIPACLCKAQNLNNTESMFRSNDGDNAGRLTIRQDPGIDSLINRHILRNMKIGGMEGFRIQIYNSSNRNAREESGKVQADFISKFPRELVSYASFAEPGWYMIRVGDFRTKTEATKYLIM